MKQLAECKVSVSEGKKLIRHIAEVKRGYNTYYFEINKEIDYISVYFIDEAKRRFSIASVKEILTLIPNEIERKRYRNIIGDASWLLLDGTHDFRSMTKEEQAAFLYLKENVLNDMEIE
ncbi:hypothetical protein SAMN04488168_110129 [Bacillus sp. 491mf]|uniref:hypothetical protein n=1 Tax=Bacillus sp. 491mf TaxID=1761755 RepID=UPI0008EE3C8E|nr:hypothetical protein [Bacillus sp. 491mf]SFC84847.1 hypothetical protein SAMN04488168_110129 [Bacillus sp. 491mf]